MRFAEPESSSLAPRRVPRANSAIVFFALARARRNWPGAAPPPAPAAIMAPQGQGRSQATRAASQPAPATRAAMAPVVQQEAPGASSAEVVTLKQTVDDQAAKIAELEAKTAKIDELEAGLARLLALVGSGGLAAVTKAATGTCTAMHGYAAKQLRVAHPCPSIEPQLNPCRSSAVVCFFAIIE